MNRWGNFLMEWLMLFLCLIPGVITKESYENDSFFNGLFCFHSTRPAEYEAKVPEVLMSGNHKKIIREWRIKES